MIRCQIILLAQGVVRDAETNNVSIFNILEEVKAKSFPVFIPEVACFAYLVNDAEAPGVVENELVVTLGDDELLRTPVTSDFQGKHRNRLTVKIGGLPLPHPGVLRVTLTNPDGDELGHYEMIVGRLGGPEVKTESQPPSSAEIRDE